MKKEIALSVLLFFFCSIDISSQIPINGFCKLSEVSVSSIYTSIAAIDYSLDGYRDLILFNPTTNKYCTITADSRSSFGKPSERYSSFYLADLKQFSMGKNDRRFLGISRSTREAGVVSFNKAGAFSVSSKLKIDGSPSSQDAGKVEEGNSQILLYAGSGVDGLILAKLQNGRTKEVDRIKGKIFSSALFLDLNYDGYDDIAAVDLLSNSIVFYNNDAFGSFEETRSIGLGSEIRDFKTIDFNSDKFTDLIYIKKNKLEILLGDSVSSFQKKIVIDPEPGIEKFTVMDFNGDGYNDIAFIDSKKAKVHLMYAKADNSYYLPLVYVTKSNLFDVISYVDRGGRKLAALSADGSVFVISTLSILDDNYKLAASETAVSITAFDYNKDNYKELAYIDAGSNSLKVGLSERRNLFRTFYSLSLSTTPDRVVVDDSKRSATLFICYKAGSREIEVIRCDFEKNKINKQILYTDYSIKEVKCVTDRLKDRIRICALTLQNNTLFLNEFELRNLRTTSVNKWLVAQNVEDASFNFNVYKDVYAMIRLGNNVDLVKIVFDKKEIKRIPRLTFRLEEGENIESQMLSVDDIVFRTKPAAALLTFPKKSVFYYFWDEKNVRIEMNDKAFQNLPLKYSLDGDKILFFALSGNKSKLTEILPSAKSTKTITRIEESKIIDYFVDALNGKNKFLVYIGGNNNLITIKKYL